MENKHQNEKQKPYNLTYFIRFSVLFFDSKTCSVFY